MEVAFGSPEVETSTSQGEPDRNLHKANIQGHVGYTNLVHQLFVTLYHMHPHAANCTRMICDVGFLPPHDFTLFSRPVSMFNRFFWGASNRKSNEQFTLRLTVLHQSATTLARRVGPWRAPSKPVDMVFFFTISHPPPPKKLPWK